MDVDAIIEDSVKFAETAIDCDTKGHVGEAIFYYKVQAITFNLFALYLVLPSIY